MPPLVKRTSSISTWLAFALGLTISGVQGYASIHQRMDDQLNYSGPFDFMTLLGLMGLFLPAIIAAYAAALTAHRVRQASFELIMVTPISNGKLVRNLVGANLNRWKLLLVFEVGLIPLSVAQGMLPNAFACAGGCELLWTSGGPVQGGLSAFIGSVGAWVLCILALVSGVGLGLWLRKSPATAASTAACLFVVLIIASLLLSTFPISSNLEDWRYGYSVATWETMILNQCVLPVALLIPAFLLAVQFARRYE